MKRLYTLGMALALCAFGTTSFAQVQMHEAEFTYDLTDKLESKSRTISNERKGGDTEIYYTEDFADGIDDWDQEGDAGDLWFYTFPVGAENGYDPEASFGGDYGDFLPNYFGTRDVCASPTRDNGVLMVDADRWNSTATNPDDEPGPNTTSNVLITAITSPAIDLTGIDFAVITWYQYVRLCCAGGSQVSLDFSVDGGTTFIPYDVFTPYGAVNGDVDVFAQVNISDVLQQADDLTDCRIRFNFDGGATHYFWSIDDINIESLPANDIAAGETFTNSYHELNAGFNAGTALAVDYYNEFEYLTSPDYITRPYNFAMIISNTGANAQTDVKMIVDVTTPTGTVVSFESEGITLESATSDTVSTGPIEFGDEMGQIPLEVGQYTFDYRAEQAEDDERPDDNVGDSRGSRISNDADNDGFAIFRNDGDVYNGAYTTLGQDVIWSSPYVFSEPTAENAVITHVEAVLQFNADFAETVAGEVIYFNVRSGSVLEEDPEVPESITTVFFDSENPLEYEDGDLEFTIEESDIWDADLDGTPYTVYATFLLPNPIMINAGEVYQAEFRVPAAGEGIVFPAVSGGQEQFSGTLYDFADGAWFFLGNNSMCTRFRTSSASSVEEVSYESGVQLLQNYPNPFNDVTRIQYRLDETADVTFEVFDMAGKLVHSEDHGLVPAGIAQTFNFDRTGLSAGVYTYSIVSNGERVTRKLSID